MRKKKRRRKNEKLTIAKQRGSRRSKSRLKGKQRYWPASKESLPAPESRLGPHYEPPSLEVEYDSAKEKPRPLHSQSNAGHKPPSLEAEYDSAKEKLRPPHNQSDASHKPPSLKVEWRLLTAENSSAVERLRIDDIILLLYYCVHMGHPLGKLLRCDYTHMSAVLFPGLRVKECGACSGTHTGGFSILVTAIVLPGADNLREPAHSGKLILFKMGTRYILGTKMGYPVQIKTSNLHTIRNISSRLKGQWHRAFEKTHGNLLQILEVETQPEALEALIQYYDTPARCFTFGDFQMAPTLEEYERLLGLPLADLGSLYFHQDQTPSWGTIARLLKSSEEEIARAKKNRNGTEGLPRAYLEQRLDLFQKGED
ncbi:hypothetical protein CR513_61439, partial [Mucuna pruriens]